MDPLSMTASIGAILQVTTMLTSYINDVRRAPTDQKKLAIEASNLYCLLTNLRFRVEEAQSNDPWFQQVKLLGIENGPLDQFKDILNRLVNHITSSRKRDQLKSVMTWSFTKSEVENALAQMERLKSLIQCALTGDLLTLSQAIRGDIEILEKHMKMLDVRTERLETNADQELKYRLAHWLGISDPSTNYHTALKKRHPNTGLWLVNGVEFENWKSSESSMIWLHGNAGCGKTVLSATALQSILKYQESQSSIIVCFFYFDFKDVEKRSSSKAIRSLLFQFAQRIPTGIRELEQLHEKCENGGQQPAEDAILSLLQSMMDQTESKYVVLDALDECTDREDLLTFICDLVGLKLKGLHVMTTSRKERDIEEQLSLVADKIISIQSAIVDEDIRLYVQDRLIKDHKLKKWSESVRNEIISVMMKKARGMFRWAYCQLESIRECVKLKALREALSSLPQTLDETYERILQRLKTTTHFHDTITALQWLCYSNRPLRASEMVEVLAIETGEGGGFSEEDRLADPTYITLICSSLISCNAVGHGDHKGREDYEDSEDSEDYEDNHDYGDAQDYIVQLAHFSVKQYLLSDQCPLRSKFNTQICHEKIAEGCLRYLFYLSEHTPLTREVVVQHPLARYAACHWFRHAQNLDGAESRTMVTLLLRLFTMQQALLTWAQLLESFDPRNSDSSLSYTSDDVAPPLVIAAGVGLSETVKELLLLGLDVDAHGESILDAVLQVACEGGHDKVVQILLDAGVEINALGRDNRYVLQVASACGHDKVVQLLLNAGADLNAQQVRHSTALQAASMGGHEKVLHMLLKAGADVNAQAGNYTEIQVALYAASEAGHDKVVQILLDTGADIDAEGGYYGNALSTASYHGREKVVQMLLDAGANINARGVYLHGYVPEDIGLGGTSLYAASYGGHYKVVQILLDAGADSNAQGGCHGYALHAACYRGSEKVVQILLDTGADVNAQGGEYGSALSYASLGGYEKLVRILLDAGADVDAPRDDLFITPLQVASTSGHEKVLQILLDAGADVNAQGGNYYGSALQQASKNGHVRLVRMLLDAGANVNAQERGHYQGTALQEASFAGYDEVVQILLDAGADVDATGAKGTALQAASRVGKGKVVQILLSAGAKDDRSSN